jgi:hypothetical protein
VQKILPSVFLILQLLVFQANAQQFNALEPSENQGALLAQLGIVRMVTTYSTTSSTRAPFITRTQESYFDTFGRITRSKHDLCDECGTVYEYDSLSGLVSYTRETSADDVTENFKEYDAQQRRSAIETCGSKEPSCITYWFEYDSAQVQRVYKTERTTRLGYNKANRTRLKHTWQTKRELIQELFFSPEGVLEESKFYEKGEYSYSLFYEYDLQGRLTQTWSVYNGIKKLFAAIEYNEKGQISLTKTAYFRGSPGMLNFELSTKTYEYADNGLLVKSGTSTNIRKYAYFTE